MAIVPVPVTVKFVGDVPALKAVLEVVITRNVPVSVANVRTALPDDAEKDPTLAVKLFRPNVPAVSVSVLVPDRVRLLPSRMPPPRALTTTGRSIVTPLAVNVLIPVVLSKERFEVDALTSIPDDKVTSPYNETPVGDHVPPYPVKSKFLKGLEPVDNA
jgi:hypothetical protein